MLDSVVKAKKYYSPTILEECRYEPKKIRMENDDYDLEKSSYHGLDNKADNDSNNETESDDVNDESKSYRKSKKVF